VPIEYLIDSGRPLEAWEAIQGLPPRLKFTTQAMRQRLRCAILLGWTRRAKMLEEAIATIPGEGEFAAPGSVTSASSSAVEIFRGRQLVIS